MSTRIKFFRDGEQARSTYQFLGVRGFKSYLRERGSSQSGSGVSGFDLFALRDEDADEMKKIVEYEFGSSWGENPT